MTAQFKPEGPAKDFDPKGGPIGQPLQTLPIDGHRIVLLEQGTGYHVVSMAPHVATIEELTTTSSTTRRFWIEGHIEGATSIEAWAGSSRARLAIEVEPRKLLTFPKQIRMMNREEYAIVSRVLGSKLPARFRIWITDAYTDDHRPFVIPTSIITTIFSSAFGLPGVAVGYLGSATNLGYLINVGHRYGDLTSSSELQRLLVHETVHVWQGYNGWLANSFFLEAMWCHATLGRASYDYKPGKKWSEYNPEQQANIVQTWFLDLEPESGPLWPYIEDNFRDSQPSGEKPCADYEESMALKCKT